MNILQIITDRRAASFVAGRLAGVAGPARSHTPLHLSTVACATHAHALHAPYAGAHIMGEGVYTTPG